MQDVPRHQEVPHGEVLVESATTRTGRGGAGLLRALFLLSTAPLLGGCYVARQAVGQADILIHSRDLLEVYGDRGLSEAKARRLDIIVEAKRFAEEELGLRESRNYTTFYDTGRRPVTWIVSAVRKDAFEVKTWWFPVVGTVPYKGFFDPADARAEAESLEREGWDVDVSEAAAYSTLGWFTDPVYSSMLEMSEAGLASTIIHELLHGTIYVDGHSDFNESLAEFVGTEGAVQFLERRYGRQSPAVKAARASFEDAARFDAWNRDLYRRLDALYRSGVSREEKLSRREAIFGEARKEFNRLAPGFSSAGFSRMRDPELDNARIVARLRYGRYNAFRRAYERVQGSWPAFFAAVSAAVAGGKPSAFADAPAPER